MNLTLIHNELLPIYTTDKGNKVVDARELHKFLGVKRQFSNWIKEKFDGHNLTENQDFCLLNKNVKQKNRGGSNRLDYILRLETAKIIAMGTNNTKGDEIKNYFLKCERIAVAAMTGTPIGSLTEHTKREIQISNVKAVNSTLYHSPEHNAICDYHRSLTKELTGKTPSQLKKGAKVAGVPSKYRTSGREVMRLTNPGAACAASVCDDLRSKGKSLEEITPAAHKLKDAFDEIIKLGFLPKELTAA